MSEPRRDIIWLKSPRVTAAEIIADVAQRRGFTVDDLKGASKTQAVSHARQEAMWEIRQRTGQSYPQISARFNRKDHTTSWHGVRAHERRMAEGA